MSDVGMSSTGELRGGTPAARLAAALTIAAERADHAKVLGLLAEARADPELLGSVCQVLAFSSASLARQLALAQAALAQAPRVQPRRLPRRKR